MVDLKNVSGLFFFSVFYLVSGIALLVPVILSGSTPLHVVSLGVLSLAAAYGLYKKKSWGTYLAILVSLPGIAFGCFTILAFYQTAGLGLVGVVLISATILYVTLLAVSLLYAAYKGSRIE